MASRRPSSTPFTLRIFSAIALATLLATPASAQSHGGFVLLHSFGADEAGRPTASPILATDNDFYGTTTDPSNDLGGNARNHGTVFRMTPDGAVTVLHTFVREHVYYGVPEVMGGLVQATDGNFYGTTPGGGAGDYGTIFRLTPDGTVTVLHNFNDPVFTGPTDGRNPAAALIQSRDGNLYGTADGGGLGSTNPVGGGTVFRVTLDGTFKVLYRFSRLDVTDVSGLVEGTDGNFYGTTARGPRFVFPSAGSVFRVSPDGARTTLHVFTGADGGEPTGVIQASNGNLYGVANAGGAFDLGTVFTMTPAGTLTVLHSFAGGPDGANPSGGLVEGQDGNFYGTTTSGGASNLGTIFRMTPAGEVTILHAFTGQDGATPSAGLVRFPDASLYGTTREGGGANAGVAFRLITPETSYQPFTDDVLTAGSTAVRAVHFTELRERVDALRGRWGLAPFQWTDPTLAGGTTLIRAQHIRDLRAALQEAYVAAGRTPPAFGPDPDDETPIRAVHLAELRGFVMGLE